MSLLPATQIPGIANYLAQQWSPVSTVPVFSPTELSDEKNFFQALQKRIQFLMDNHFDFLIQLLYRLDIPENNLKSSIKTNGPENAAATITSAIIQREFLRNQTRNANNTDLWSFE